MDGRKMIHVSSRNQERGSAFFGCDLLNFGQSHFFFVRKHPEKSSDELRMKTMNKYFLLIDIGTERMCKVN